MRPVRNPLAREVGEKAFCHLQDKDIPRGSFVGNIKSLRLLYRGWRTCTSAPKMPVDNVH